MSFLPDDYSLPKVDKTYMGIRTHSRYAANISILIRNKKLSFSLPKVNETISLENEKRIIRKLEIVKYTLETIKREYQFADQESDFLPLSLSWLWIKGYYSVFHLSSLLISLLNNDSRYMTDRKYNEHTKIISILNSLVGSKKPFNVTSLNSIFSGSQLEVFRDSEYRNLKGIENFSDELYKLSIKKVYSEEKKIHIKGMRGDKRKEYLNRIGSKCYSIFDLFLYYRERFNYAGFQYLDSEEKPSNLHELKIFYLSSYNVIHTISASLIDALIYNSYGDIHIMLKEIKKVL